MSRDLSGGGRGGCGEAERAGGVSGANPAAKGKDLPGAQGAEARRTGSAVVPWRSGAGTGAILPAEPPEKHGQELVRCMRDPR